VFASSALSFKAVCVAVETGRLTGSIFFCNPVASVVVNAGKVTRKIGAFFDGTLGKIWTKFEKPSSTQE